jgi:hypothetical protein
MLREGGRAHRVWQWKETKVNRPRFVPVDGVDVVDVCTAEDEQVNHEAVAVHGGVEDGAVAAVVHHVDLGSDESINHC